MKRQRQILILLTLLLGLLAATTIHAQTTQPLAYTNSGGQLVITQPANGFRWIVTNPGEVLLPDVNLAWDDTGTRLLFGVGGGGGYSLRVADLRAEQVTEVLAGRGAISGGGWAASGAVVVGTPEGITLVSTNGVSVLAPGGASAGGEMVSADGNYVFYRAGSGFAVVEATPGAQPTALTGTNRAAVTGYWADRSPIVAYWGSAADGTTLLLIHHAANGAELAVSTGSGVPLTLLGWAPGQTTVLYLDAGGVRAQDASCLLQANCDSAPAPVTLLPVNAGDVAVTDAGLVAFTLNGERFVADGNCLTVGNCTAGAASVGMVMPRTRAYTRVNTTAFTSATDGTVQLVDLICATQTGGGVCPPVASVSGTVVGVAPGGGNALAVAGDQLALVGPDVIPLGAASAGARTAWGVG